MDEDKEFVLKVYPNAKLAGMRENGFIILNELKKKSICLSNYFERTPEGAWYQVRNIILKQTLATFER